MWDRKTPAGYPAIYGCDPRSLSGAQEYVLTLRTEIGDQLELDAMRVRTHEAQRSETLRDERLRLLESVGVNAHDAVWITDAEPIDLPGPRIVFANAAFSRTTGYELEEIIGLTPRILQGPGTSDAMRERLRSALGRWEPVEVEMLNYHRNRTPFWGELSIVPVADQNGYFTHWVSVQRDVTERKAAEESASRALISEAASAALEHRAFHAELTGLRNRAYLNDRVETLIGRLHEDHGQCFAVLFFDLDRFKVVNDSLGHRVGEHEHRHRLRRQALPKLGRDLSRRGHRDVPRQAQRRYALRTLSRYDARTCARGIARADGSAGRDRP